MVGNNSMVSVSIGNRSMMVQQWKADIINQREKLKQQAIFLSRNGIEGSEETLILINQKIRFLNGKIDV